MTFFLNPKVKKGESTNYDLQKYGCPVKQYGCPVKQYAIYLFYIFLPSSFHSRTDRLNREKGGVRGNRGGEVTWRGRPRGVFYLEGGGGVPGGVFGGGGWGR